MKRESDDIDKLFQIPLTEFTSARNALAARLKKEGDAEGAEGVKNLSKPSVSAWVANQLYWRHRKAFDRLLEAGDQFRKAQTAQLSGRSADVRAPLEARREALADMSKEAAAVLRDSGHPPSPDTMRRVMTTLEALATYGEQDSGPQAGRLTADVQPPGFEALAALVPRGIDRVGQRQAPPRVIPFNQPKPEPHGKKAAEDKTEARKALREAERALADAKKAAERARKAMKDAAARAKAAEKAKASLEARFEKLGTAAEAARQDARRIASEAEDAAQAVDDAERAVRNAREKLKG